MDASDRYHTSSDHSKMHDKTYFGRNAEEVQADWLHQRSVLKADHVQDGQSVANKWQDTQGLGAVKKQNSVNLDELQNEIRAL